MGNKFIPLHCHTHSSLLDGLSSAQDVVDRCLELEYKACAITDHGNICEAVPFMKAAKKAGIKPIIGCEFYLSKNHPSIQSKENPNWAHLVVLAKNKNGWSDLVQATSESNKKHNFYFKPRLSLETLAPFVKGNFVSFSGHIGSELANILFDDYKSAYKAKTETEAASFLSNSWQQNAVELANKYKDIFGKDNFFIEIQLIDQDNVPATKIIAKALRIVSEITKLRCVATSDSHYAKRENAEDQRVLLSNNVNIPIPEILRKIQQDDFGLSSFFKSTNYHIPATEELVFNTETEINNSYLISEMCEEYDIFAKPMLPSFNTPGNISEKEYLTELLRLGWIQKNLNSLSQTEKDVYINRIKKELEVITSYSILPSYFLIVQDFVNWYRSLDEITGPGRGSAAGCLISYLLNITSVDPIKYNLLFERFYNSGRNTADRVSLPDIDIDFSPSRRNDVINYIRTKYGNEKVCHISIFGRTMGRGAMKDVLRAHGVCSNDEMNQITKPIPNEAEIADELQEMKEDGEDPSIISWALENRADKLREWCYKDDTGNLVGPLAPYFAQAIRLEGKKRTKGKHPSGIIISPINISEVCPVSYDKNDGEMVAEFDMHAMEAMGFPKFDILGLSLLSKLTEIKRNVNIYTK